MSGPRNIVTLLLIHGDDVLVLLRSQGVATLPGLWAGISGRIEPGESPAEAALREMGEETGLSAGDVVLDVFGGVIEIDDAANGLRWVVHPILGRLRERRDLRLDWEHAAYRWIAPGDVGLIGAVPGLETCLHGLLGGRPEARGLPPGASN